MDKLQTPKGFRDFLPEQTRVRNWVRGILIEVFENFGFEPLETPTLEYASTLLGKYGAEADKLVYTFKDRGGRELGLNYDLTVPAARVLAQYQNQISLPFKRYQIQPAYRAENPQKGRYRQFIQCDVDTFGVASPLADAEIIAVIYTVLKKLNFDKFKIRINSRQVLFQMLEQAGIGDKKLQLAVLQSIDKLDKKSEDEVIQEVQNKGLSDSMATTLLEIIKQAQPDQGLQELFDYLEQYGIDKSYWEFSPSLVRGLDYYTSAIFETYVEEPKIGSVTGGGRYDNLISQLGGPDTPATGTTIGFDRICDVIEELGLIKSVDKKRVLVTIFSPELVNKSIETTGFLRDRQIACELYPDPNTKLEKQLKYADKKQIPFVVIIGPEEASNNQVVCKDLKTGEQEKLSMEKLIERLSRN